MKFMVTFSWQPDPQQRAEGVARFQKLGAQVPGGARLVGRLTRADLGGGFVLLEAEDARALAEFCYAWSDLMSLSVTPVVDDEGLGRVFSAVPAPAPAHSARGRARGRKARGAA
jgi:hypothetical protein